MPGLIRDSFGSEHKQKTKETLKNLQITDWHLSADPGCLVFCKFLLPVRNCGQASEVSNGDFLTNNIYFSIQQ